MKNIFLLLIVLLIVNPCFSQDDLREGYFNKTKLGFLLRLDEKPEGRGLSKNGSGTEMSTINGLYLNESVSMGIGIGISTYVNPTITSIPLYADFQYFLLKRKKTPFLYADLGHSFLSKKNYQGGMIFNAGLGYNLKLARHLRISPELGYRLQKYSITSGNSKIDASVSSLAVGVSVSF